MYRRPKFLEVLLEIRREMAAEADHSVEVLAEIARTGRVPKDTKPAASIEAPAVGTKTARRTRSRTRLVKT